MMTDAADRMADDLAEGYQDVARGLARMTRHLGADAGGALAHSATTLGRTSSDLARKTKKQSEALAKRAKEEIREHPITTAAAAAAVVALFGYAIRRRRPDRRGA